MIGEWLIISIIGSTTRAENKDAAEQKESGDAEPMRSKRFASG